MSIFYHSHVHATPPPVLIKSLNPGYTVDGRSNTGELIELTKLSPDSISLAGLSIGYTNSSGKKTIIYAFPDGSQMTGETLSLRLASSPTSELADATYTTSLAMKAGPLELIYDSAVLDSVCWTGKDGCFSSFRSQDPTTLVRDLDSLDFTHQADYQPTPFDPLRLSLTLSIDDEIPPAQCQGLEFSEVLSFYETSRSEQFIELYNPTADQILLDGCQLFYKNRHFPLSGIIPPESYFTRYATDFSLTKNPTSLNQIFLIDTNGATVATLNLPNGQKKATSFARFGFHSDGTAQWLSTYAPTPGEPNHYQQFRTCPPGKVINEATGNCVKPITVKTLEPCPPGKYRNPLTGRCKNLITIPAPKICPAGYTLNPATNRCRKIPSVNTGASYPLTPTTSTPASTFIALGALIFIIVLGLLYIAYEYRCEIAKLFHNKNRTKLPQLPRLPKPLSNFLSKFRKSKPPKTPKPRDS